MTINDIVIVTNLGEMKIYQAQPRNLEAEAGLKPNHVKLDLVNTFDYIASHWKINDVVTDSAGQFKGGGQGKGTFTRGSIGEAHNLEAHIEDEVVDLIAQDISKAIEANQPPKWYLALPGNIYNRVVEKLSESAKSKLEKSIEKDLVKSDKNDLIERFSAQF
jgi:hypothetical protein